MNTTLQTKDATSPTVKIHRNGRQLANRLANAQKKIREELIRFRTCCADPRASK